MKWQHSWHLKSQAILPLEEVDVETPVQAAKSKRDLREKTRSCAYFQSRILEWLTGF
jgi:hypothetical protein